MPRGRDAGEVELLDLAHASAAVIGWLGAGDRDIDVAQARDQGLGPGIVVGAVGRHDPLAGGALPAFPGEITKGGRRSAVDRHGDVVERRVGASGRANTALVGIGVLACVPAIIRHVDAAAEGEHVVDHDDLLVVRGPGRVALSSRNWKRRARIQFSR